MEFSLKPSDKKLKEKKQKEVPLIISTPSEYEEIIVEEFNPWDYIRVVNVRGEPEYQATKDEKIIVGHRGNPILGNPYVMLSKNMMELDRVINAYKIHLEEDLKIKGPIWKELNDIATEIVEKKQKIAIACWCTPKRCHTDLFIPIVVQIAKEKLKEKLNNELLDNNVTNKFKI